MMNDFKISARSISNMSAQGKRVLGAATSYLKTHWIDYLLLFFICLVLGAFDVFVLKRSDKFLQPEYWYHAGTRIIAYMLAGVLGVRVGYPKAKAACEDLRLAVEKNKRLCRLKDIDSVKFGGFIDTINSEVKKAAWKLQINKRLEKLEKHARAFYPLYYREKDDKYIVRYAKPLRKLVKWRAEVYCAKRATLEALLNDDFIDKNIATLSVRYYQISETDFNMLGVGGSAYKFYKTRPNMKGSAARLIGTSLIMTVIATLIIGSVKLSFDEAEAVSRIIAITTIILNAILDVGLTLWKFISAYADGDRIVRTEDLRAYLDQNELLVRYKKTLSEEVIEQYNKEMDEEFAEEQQIHNELQIA